VRPLLVPVTVMLYVPPDWEEQESVEVAAEEDRVKLVWLNEVQVSPLGRGVSESWTVPANPLTGETVIVETVDMPVLTAPGVEAEIVKLSTWKRMLPVVRDKLPLEPVTVTV
jgi:hypothetical protein